VRLEGRTVVDGKTAGELTAELGAMGARLMVEVLGDPDGHPAIVQPEAGMTYAPKVDKAEARINWARSAVEIERQVRAFAPTPGAWFEVAGERVKVLAADLLPLPAWGERGIVETAAYCASPRPSPRGGEGEVLDELLTVACGGGAIRPTIVQRAGRGVTSAAELLRGFPIPPGTRL
jgi:methionyl-tRNA formyltransferase